MNETQRTVYRIFSAVLVTLILLCTGAVALFPFSAGVNTVLCAVAFISGGALLGLHRQIFEQVRRLERSCQDAAVEIAHDPLTNAYDRDTSLRLMERYLQGEGREGVHGLLMLDIVDLPDIRAEKGTEYEEMVLLTCVDRIARLFRKTDIIGRLREDAFVIFLKNVGNRKQLEAQAATLLSELASRDVMPGLQLNCGIGGAVAPEDAVDCAVLLQKAESALERAKSKGKHTFALYNQQMDDVFSI